MRKRFLSPQISRLSEIEGIFSSQAKLRFKHMVRWSDQWWQTDGSSNQQPHAFWNELWNTFHWQLPPDGCVEPIIWLIVLTNSKRSSLTRRTDGNFESLLSKLFPSQPERVFTTLPSPSPKKKKEEISCYFSFFAYLRISEFRFLWHGFYLLLRAPWGQPSPLAPARVFLPVTGLISHRGHRERDETSKTEK